MRYSKGVYIWLNFFYEYRDWRVLFCRRDNNRKCVCATLCLLCLMSNASYSGTLVNQKQLKEIVKENCLRTRQILSVLKMKIYWMWLLWVLVFAKKRPKKKYPNKNSVHITGKMLALKYHSTAEFLILLAQIVDEISLRAVPAPITSLYLTCLF